MRTVDMLTIYVYSGFLDTIFHWILGYKYMEAKVSKPKNIRKYNAAVVLNLFKKGSILSAADIMKHVQLSKPTIMKILDYLESKELIITQGKGPSSDEGGRRPNLYMLNAQKSYSLAFHIFPNELYGVITDLKCSILKSVSRQINSSILFNDIVDLIISCVMELTKDYTKVNDLTGIAIGSHGATDNKTGVTFYAPHFLNWGNHADFKTSVSSALNSSIPIIVDNQIRFQLLSEQFFWDGQYPLNMVVVEAGKGLVAGIMVKGDIKRGKHFLAGEIGHMIINPGGDLCVCGGKGCFEAMVTTDRILDKAKKAYSNNKDSIIFRRTDIETLSIFDIFNASNKKDSLACFLIDDLAYWFAIGFINLQLMYDPDHVIIQGVYSLAGSYFLNSLNYYIQELSPLLKDEKLDIRLSLLGKNRSVIGAAWLLAEKYFSNFFDLM